MTSNAVAASDAPPQTRRGGGWRVAVLVVVIIALAFATWLFGFAGMRLGALRAGTLLIAVPAALTWLLYRGRATQPPAVVWVAAIGAVLTVALVVTAPLMPDRLLAAFPAEVVPEDAVVRETVLFGNSGLQLTGPSATRWYEVSGDPDRVEAAVRRDLQARGWTISDLEDPMFDFEATSPDRAVDATIAVGVPSQRQRFESGSNEPLPQDPSNTILEVGVRVHH